MNQSYKKWWLTSGKVGNQAPMPFEIPKGWRSQHTEVEASLLTQFPERTKRKDLIANDRKWFANMFHKPTKKLRHGENLTELEFNPFRLKKGSPEVRGASEGGEEEPPIRISEIEETLGPDSA